MQETRQMSDHDVALGRIVKDEEALAVPCRKVEEGDREAALRVADDLRATAKMLKNCAGLAANQLGYDLRVFVIQVKKKYRVFINPEIVYMIGSTEMEEGCFSFPGKWTKVKRASRIGLKAKNFVGTLTLAGGEAIAAQHELDHLDGVLI
jgi:peptide deformylase